MPTADVHERTNGCAYRDIEIALPRELNDTQRLALVRDFVSQEIGERHAYQFAIHNPNKELTDNLNVILALSDQTARCGTAASRY